MKHHHQPSHQDQTSSDTKSEDVVVKWLVVSIFTHHWQEGRERKGERINESEARIEHLQNNNSKSKNIDVERVP